MNNPIYLTENNRFGKEHKYALRIVCDCNSPWNLGAICWEHFCLDLQNNRCKGGRYLIGEIAALGGNFLAEKPRCRVATKCRPSPRKNGETCCWSGSSYEAGVHFESMEVAVKYLKKYFTVKACAGNSKYDQLWIDRL